LSKKTIKNEWMKIIIYETSYLFDSYEEFKKVFTDEELLIMKIIYLQFIIFSKKFLNQNIQKTVVLLLTSLNKK
jgi:hypothetical protein